MVLRMQPRHQATLTQPLQCVLQHHVANLHVSMHMATPDDNNHAAIPLAICNNRFNTRIELRTQDQPLLAEHRGGTHLRMKRPQPHLLHTEGTFHRPAATLHGKNTRFRAPSSSPKQSPCNIHAAITMRFAASLPFVTTSQSHHTPFVTTSHSHHFPSSPLPFVTTSLRHHFPSSPLPFIAFHSFVMYCYR